MNKKKIGMVFVFVGIVLIVGGASLTIFKNDVEQNIGKSEMTKNDITTLNVLLENKINNNQLAMLDNVDNTIDTTNISNLEEKSNTTIENIQEVTVNQVTEKENNQIVNNQKTQPLVQQNINVEKETNKIETPIQKTETIAKDTSKEETKVEKIEIKEEIKEKNDVISVSSNAEKTQEELKIEKQETQSANKQEIQNTLKQEVQNTKKPETQTEETNKNDNKKIAKEKMLNSICMPIEDIHRKNGKYEFKFNKTEALRTATALIEESFNSSNLWDGKNLQYKIVFKYKKEIMENAMYWPFRETAIISAVKNNNCANTIFYIWSEDYIVDSEKVHTQYCIR